MPAQNLLTPTPNPAPQGGGEKKGGEETRRSSATRNPNAAGVAPASGTTSCSAPPESPPWGRWRSMAARPKGMDRALRKPSIFGNKRRNSSATAARLRSTDWAVGWVIGGLFL